MPWNRTRPKRRLRATTPSFALESLGSDCRTAAALTTGVRSLAEAGLRLRHPGATEQELRIRFVVRIYGRAAAERLFKDRVPADAI